MNNLPIQTYESVVQPRDELENKLADLVAESNAIKDAAKSLLSEASIGYSKYKAIEIRPITLKQAREFIAEHHRHNKPPVGHKFSIGLKNSSGELVGVATAGRPVARHFDDGLTLEVNRTCTDGTKNANSMLLGAVWRAARAMGYMRCITYTQADESGASLRAAGFVRVKELPARKGWADSSVALKDKRDQVGNGGVSRVLWEIRRGL